MTLTARETEILTAIWNGLEHRTIATALGISPRTVDTHRSNLNRKLRASSVADLLRNALKENLITVERRHHANRKQESLG